MVFERVPFRHAILSGRKTRHTVPREDGELPPYKPGQVRLAQTMRWTETRPRDSLGVHRPPKRKREVETFERLRIAAVAEALLADVTEADAQREGHKDRDRFIAWWRAKGWSAGGEGLIAKPVEVGIWVIFFEVEQFQPEEYLADVRRGKGDYTTGTGIDGAPVVRAEQLDPRWASDARSRHRRDSEQVTRQLAARLRRARAQAQRNGVDDSAEVEAIELHVRALEEKVDSAAA